MIKSFTPVSDMVLVQRLEAQTATPGGIFLPTGSVEKPNRGKVIKAGPGRVLDNGMIRKMEVKEGDLVLFTPSKIADVTIEGEKYLIMSEASIIAIIEE